MYNKVRSEQVAPEMRAALSRACAHMKVERFVKELETFVKELKELRGGGRGRSASGSEYKDSVTQFLCD